MNTLFSGRVGFERGCVGTYISYCDDVSAVGLACQWVHVMGVVASGVDLHAIWVVSRVGGESEAEGKGALEVAKEMELL